MKKIRLVNGGFASVDDEDYELLSVYRWRHRSSSNTKHAYVQVAGKTRYMHRMIMCEPREQVDHIDGDGLNNCRANLRKASKSQNMSNTVLRRDNKSGYKGVSWRKDRGNWTARMRMPGGPYLALGSYNTPEDAARARDAAARLYHGEFARFNFPRAGERKAT